MVTSQLLVVSALLFGAAPQGVVYDFTATWCGPCKQMSPIVSRLKRQGYPIQKVDIDQYGQLASRYGVTSIPAFVLVVDGKEVQRIVGATTEAKLRSMLEKIPRPEPEKKSKTLLVSNPRKRGSRGEGQVAAAKKKKPGFRLPFFGKKEEDAQEDVSEATVRAKSEDPEEDGLQKSTVADPMQASVRIRANSGGAVNYGSGTIISSDNGRTLVLTCGHICRGMTNQGSMEVDIFHRGEMKTYVGKVLRFDLKADVGLLEIPTDVSYPHSPIAGADYRVKKGDRVVSVGCGGGEDPTLQKHKVLSLNRYLGPDHLECSGEPIEGRSGGGLFSEDGSVVGVCFARDPEYHSGLYAALKPIHQLLDQCELSHLYQTELEDLRKPLRGTVTIATNEMPSHSESHENAVNIMAEDGEPDIGDDSPLAALTVEESETVGADQSDLEKAVASAGEAEIVCVIRSINNPRAGNRVVILNRASEEFVRYLTEELDTDPFQNKTSLKKRVRKTAKPAAQQSPKRYTRKSPSRPSTKKTGPRRYRRNRTAPVGSKS